MREGPAGPGAPGVPGVPGGGGESAGLSEEAAVAGGDASTLSLAGTSGVTCSGDVSEKCTHFSSALTATDLGDSTGPKMLSRSLMDGGFSFGTSSVADGSFPGATGKGEPVRGGVAGTFFGGSGGGVPVGKDLVSFGESMLGLTGWPEPHISG